MYILMSLTSSDHAQVSTLRGREGEMLFYRLIYNSEKADCLLLYSCVNKEGYSAIHTNDEKRKLI